jgi:hypothetical protein
MSWSWTAQRLSRRTMDSITSPTSIFVLICLWRRIRRIRRRLPVALHPSLTERVFLVTPTPNLDYEIVHRLTWPLSSIFHSDMNKHHLITKIKRSGRPGQSYADPYTSYSAELRVRTPNSIYNIIWNLISIMIFALPFHYPSYWLTHIFLLPLAALFRSKFHQLESLQ